MRAFLCIAMTCLAVLGCKEHRDLTRYSLDESTFDDEAMEKIEKETGIDLPKGAKGLAFEHIPPMDPIVFAKIELPDDAEVSMAEQLGALTFEGTSFPKGFANDKCSWWPSPPTGVVLSKEAFNNGYYIEGFLVREGKRLVLYLEYFTI